MCVCVGHVWMQQSVTYDCGHVSCVRTDTTHTPCAEERLWIGSYRQPSALARCHHSCFDEEQQRLDPEYTHTHTHTSAPLSAEQHQNMFASYYDKTNAQKDKRTQRAGGSRAPPLSCAKWPMEPLLHPECDLLLCSGCVLSVQLKAAHHKRSRCRKKTTQTPNPPPPVQRDSRCESAAVNWRNGVL